MKHIFIIKQNYIQLYRDLASNIFTFCFNHDYDFFIVEVATDEEMIAAVQKYKMEDVIIYAVGTDVDLHLALNAIIDGKATLGIIPIGKYNDFYLSLNNYASDVVDTSVIKVNDSYGLNFFSVGLQAEMAKAKGGLDSLLTILKSKNQVIGVNNYFEKMLSLAFFNGSFYHGRKASCANINDDTIRIVMGHNMNWFERLVFFQDFLLGKHENNSQVSIFTTETNVNIEGMYPLTGYLDGELMKANEYLVVPNSKTITVVNNRPLIRELKK